MYNYSRLTQILNSAEEVVFDEKSRLVFFSDCHRGDNSKADNFSPNKSIYLSAINYYYTRGFVYIEVGDGDELWENDRFSTIFQAHKEVYLQLQKFHHEQRFYMIYGNHDIFKKCRRFVQNNLFKYYNPDSQQVESLYENIKIYQGLIIKFKNTPYRLFVVHGHQGDIFNDALWPISRILARFIWRNFENLAASNPISPARSLSRMTVVESNILRWTEATHQIVIAGHTHNPCFPKPGQIPYFNDGCCVKKGFITCIEIQNGEIMLVKWHQNAANGIATVNREVLGGPEKIGDFYKSM